jgi:putative intracellular protease/amidase
LGAKKNGGAPDLPLPHQLAATAVGRQRTPTLKSGLWLGRGTPHGRAIAVNPAAVLAVFSAWRRATTKEKIMKVLMVITSHYQLGNTGRKTGFWLEELAAPYYVFKDAGVEITLASPKGGRPPLDPMSNEPAFRTDLTLRFEKDAAAQAQLDKTLRLDSVKQQDFDTVFYPGGHGPMWDLAEDEHSIKLIESFIAAGKPIGIVCHSTGALHHVKTTDGKFLVQGKEVTGFTNGEEEEVALTKVVPFLVEDEMLKLGAVFSKVADWGVHVVSSGLLITGQNPASSGPTAKTLMAAVKQKARPPATARAS